MVPDIGLPRPPRSLAKKRELILFFTTTTATFGLDTQQMLSIPLTQVNASFINLLITTLKTQSNGPVIGTLAIDGWAVWYSWAGPQSSQAPPKCNSPPINGQCTNFALFDVAV